MGKTPARYYGARPRRATPTHDPDTRRAAPTREPDVRTRPLILIHLIVI